jgi:hypothetical protein
MAAAVLLAALPVMVPNTARSQSAYLDIADSVTTTTQGYCDELDRASPDQAASKHGGAMVALYAAQKFAADAEEAAAQELREVEGMLKQVQQSRAQVHSERWRMLRDSYRQREAQYEAFRQQYNVGPLYEEQDELATALIGIEVDISVLEAENHRRGGGSWFSTPPEVKANDARIAALKAERAAKLERQSAVAAELAKAAAVTSEIDQDHRIRSNEIGERFRDRLLALERREGELRHERANKRAAYAQRTEEKLRLKSVGNAMEN